MFVKRDKDRICIQGLSLQSSRERHEMISLDEEDRREQGEISKHLKDLNEYIQANEKWIVERSRISARAFSEHLDNLRHDEYRPRENFRGFVECEYWIR